MNERIKQLAEQATSIVEMVGPEGYTSSYANFDREKFAELIASDIVGAIRGLQLSAQEDGMLNVASTCDTIAELIEQDYGVKE
jgi:hypothetical protein